MPINYKDINELTEETTIAGTEKVPVSSTKYVLFNKIKDWIINSLKTTGLDLGGKEVKNVAIDVVTSFPATNIVGRRVTYQGRDYIWNGSAWKNDSDYLEIGGRNLITGSTFENGIAGTDWKLNGTLLGGQVDPFGTNKACLITVTQSNSYLLKTTPVFKSLGEHTISVWMKGTKAGTINIQMQDQTHKKVCNLTTAWQKYEFTANITSVAGQYRFVFGGWSSWIDLALGVYFAFPKLEKGNKATDWTPAPEDKANESQTINFNINTEPAQAGTATKTSTWLWQYLTESTNFLWTKLKGLFNLTQATTHNYIPKIDNANKKLIRSNIYDDGTTPKYGTNTIWHSGNDGSTSGLNADLLDDKHASDFITPADFETNQLYPPTLNPVWNIVKSNGTTPSGITRTSSAITLEYGYRPSATVQAKWTKPSGFDTPERSDGLCGVYNPILAINTDTNPAVNIPYATNFAPANPTVPSKSVIVWNIYANKKGITVSGNKLIMPVGEVSANALLSVIYQLPIYYGVVTVNSMTEIIIKALPSPSPIMKNCSTGSKTFSPTINALDTQYWVYAYPSAWGVLSNISNADGDWKAAFTTGLIDITSSDTLLKTQYRYYITINRGAFKSKTINFS